MKKNSVSKNNAVPKYDQGTVCGITIRKTCEANTFSPSGLSESGINWNENNWLASSDLFRNDVTSVLSRSEDCGALCMSTPGCTHYTWTNYNGDTCWMKRKAINTVPKYDQDDQGSDFFFGHFGRPIPKYNQVIINLA